MRRDRGGPEPRSVRKKRESDSQKHRERDGNKRFNYNVNNDYNRQTGNRPKTEVPRTHTDDTENARWSLCWKHTGLHAAEATDTET